ncbi:glycosyltransferase [Aquamicrobium sp. LC103]|uniref:glycosyltransferase family 2 protein n=1 Tax=Aquamicrobium sp. LC103 TaxID=1120658 RepID=UPI00069A9ACF|nr:glycosyltransferase [Aquamicrobium sp. LC103]TKT80270.1 glycosyltransferase family 2 protein [Aquamicrobium sp. LC103]
MPCVVSVILPTYNRSGSLPAAISSVLTQSFRDLELIVVDDCSSEDLAEVARASGDERVKYVRRPVNGGAGAARNTGLDLAQGDYIAFQDSDDLWLPGKLDRQLALLSSLPRSVGVVTGAKIIYGRDARKHAGAGKVDCAPSPGRRLRLDADQVGELLTENRLSVQNALFRRECFDDGTRFDACARANEDWELAVRLARKTRIYEDAEPVVLAFVSGDSISSDTRKGMIGMLRIARANKAELAARPKIRSTMLIDIGRHLHKAGKRSSGRKFILAGLSHYPLNIMFVPVSLARKAASMLERTLRAARSVTGKSQPYSG